MALWAATLCARDRSLAAMLSVAAVIGAVALPGAGLWAVPGLHVGHRLDARGRLRAFNLTMAALLPAPLWPVLAG
ncbi:MAG: hypothetical protein ACLFTP_03430 [Rhodosalinus sp.]|uniref:hypothetical protein n=1 Tax=Rhodosalinus sp. TaxID=2047741 RepID=UPI003978632D